MWEEVAGGAEGGDRRAWEGGETCEGRAVAAVLEVFCSVLVYGVR